MLEGEDMEKDIKQIPAFRLNMDNPLERQVSQLLDGAVNKKQYIVSALMKAHEVDTIEEFADNLLKVVKEEINKKEEITKPDDLSV